MLLQLFSILFPLIQLRWLSSNSKTSHSFFIIFVSYKCLIHIFGSPHPHTLAQPSHLSYSTTWRQRPNKPNFVRMRGFSRCSHLVTHCHMHQPSRSNPISIEQQRSRVLSSYPCKFTHYVLQADEGFMICMDRSSSEILHYGFMIWYAVDMMIVMGFSFLNVSCWFCFYLVDLDYICFCFRIGWTQWFGDRGIRNL